jgi:CDP-glucose 4,6-dehydratase
MGVGTGPVEGVVLNPQGAFAGLPVLVTGHTGFKGSWLALWLHRLGAKVSGFALPPPTEPSNFYASRVGELLEHHVVGDVRERDAVHAAVEQTKPRVLFHLAAQPIVRESYETPYETFDVNVMGTAAVLEAVRRRGAPCVVVVVTSDKCYENQEQLWGYRETDPMGGRDPYSASKGATELVVASYRRAFFAPDALDRHGVCVASARAGNVIGGGDWAKDRLVVDCMRALSRSEPVIVRNPTSVRPWQHVLEPLGGYLHLAAEMLARPSATVAAGWNFGPSIADCVPAERLVAEVCRAWGDGRWEVRAPAHAPHEAGLLRLNIEKAQTVLGWQPRWRVSEAVARTVSWYRAFYERPGASMSAACESDIEAYERA